MTTREKIEAIRTEFPKHSKAAYSLATRTKDTGVMLCPRARELSQGARKDRHAKLYSLRVRVSKSQYERVKHAREAEGRYSTTQALLEGLIFDWVAKIENAAPDADTIEDGERLENPSKPVSYSITTGGGCQ